MYANDLPYHFTQGYEVIAIDPDPDTCLIKAMMEHFPMIRYSRHYAADGLNHDVFLLYY